MRKLIFLIVCAITLQVNAQTFYLSKTIDTATCKLRFKNSAGTKFAELDATSLTFAVDMIGSVVIKDGNYQVTVKNNGILTSPTFTNLPAYLLGVQTNCLGYGVGIGVQNLSITGKAVSISGANTINIPRTVDSAYKTVANDSTVFPISGSGNILKRVALPDRDSQSLHLNLYTGEFDLSLTRGGSPLVFKYNIDSLETKTDSVITWQGMVGGKIRKSHPITVSGGGGGVSQGTLDDSCSAINGRIGGGSNISNADLTSDGNHTLDVNTHDLTVTNANDIHFSTSNSYDFKTGYEAVIRNPTGEEWFVVRTTGGGSYVDIGDHGNNYNHTLLTVDDANSKIVLHSPTVIADQLPYVSTVDTATGIKDGHLVNYPAPSGGETVIELGSFDYNDLNDAAGIGNYGGSFQLSDSIPAGYYALGYYVETDTAYTGGTPPFLTGIQDMYLYNYFSQPTVASTTFSDDAFVKLIPFNDVSTLVFYRGDRQYNKYNVNVAVTMEFRYFTSTTITNLDSLFTTGHTIIKAIIKAFP